MIHAATGSTRVEVSAGGVVYRKDRGRIVIGFILDPFSKWTFAKGHLEGGESVAEGAVREVEEEMGITGLRLKGKLGTTDFWFAREGVRIHKFVHFFLMEAPSRAYGHAQADEKIQAIRWVPVEKAVRTASYKNTTHIVHEAVRRLTGNGRTPL